MTNSNCEVFIDCLYCVLHFRLKITGLLVSVTKVWNRKVIFNDSTEYFCSVSMETAPESQQCIFSRSDPYFCLCFTDENFMCLTKHEPIGVCGAIVPVSPEGTCFKFMSNNNAWNRNSYYCCNTLAWCRRYLSSDGTHTGIVVHITACVCLGCSK